MSRCIALLLLITYGSCMEMRETVERTVMVRTTGSDLQPAATGYIYKKGSDGEAVVTKMGETEVMEQLSKLYQQPKAFAAPIPISSPFSIEDDTKAASKIKEHVIPVEEKSDDAVDGIADEDYRKFFDEYANNFDDYLKGLERFKGGAYDRYDKKDGFDLHGHQYGKQGAGDYDTKKYESYYLSRKDDRHPHDSDVYKHEEFKNGHYSDFKGLDDEGNRFRHKKIDETDHDKFTIKDDYKYGDERKYYGDAGTEDRHAYGSEYHDDLGKERAEQYDNASTNSDEDSTTNAYGAVENKSGLAVGKSFGYEVKH